MSLSTWALTPALVREIHALDANVAPSEVITMREQVERTTAPQRISVTMLIVFGGLALVLAAIGLYGVMAATVAQGARQLALRMALGADASQVLRLVLGRGFTVTAVGLVVGTGLALAAGRLLQSQLLGESFTDPLTLVSIPLLLITVSLFACLVPARRATKVDPVVALRYE